MHSRKIKQLRMSHWASPLAALFEMDMLPWDVINVRSKFAVNTHYQWHLTLLAEIRNRFNFPRNMKIDSCINAADSKFFAFVIRLR